MRTYDGTLSPDRADAGFDLVGPSRSSPKTAANGVIFLNSASPLPAVADPVQRRGAPARRIPSTARLAPETRSFYHRLFRIYGLNVRDYRDAVLARRAAACLRALRAADTEHALGALYHDNAGSQRALSAALIGVTSFFRDAPAFQALRRVLPALARRLGRPPRVLSVGCSDGSELYSVAMLAFETRVWPAPLAGFDCRPSAVAAARTGEFCVSRMDVMPARLRRKYFDRVRAAGGGLQRMRVRAEIRERCQWWVGNALELEPIRRYDLVLCRNLSIYLKPTAADELWGRIRRVLAPAGLLMVGKAERPPDFERIGPSLYRLPRTDLD